MPKKFFTFIITIFAALFILPACSYAKTNDKIDFTKDTIYFIVVDRFCDGDPSNNPAGKIYSPGRSQWNLYWGGDLQGIIDHLPYIKRLGCTAIWLTPVIDNSEEACYYGDKDKRERISAYHGYWGRDFYRINSYFGTKEKYKELVAKAHKLGIKVIFDYVLNHTSPICQGADGAIYKDGKFIADYSNDPEAWFHHSGSIDFSKDDPAERQDKNLYDLADLNSENNKVEEYLFDAAKMWMETGFDGFRLDTARHIPIDFTARFAKEMKKKKPDLYLFGEWASGGLNAPGAVDFVRRTGISMIDFGYTHLITDVICRNKSFKTMADYIKLHNNIKDPDLSVNCIDNHDMPRFISTAVGSGFSFERAKKKTEMAMYIMMMSRGIPCIYYGTEHFMHTGKDSAGGYGGEPYNRQMMCGFDDSNSFIKNIKLLADARKNIPALSKGVQKTIFVSDDIWVFERKLGSSTVLVAANKGRACQVKVSGLHIPDGSYSSKGKLIGSPIKVRNSASSLNIGEDEVCIWYSK